MKFDIHDYDGQLAGAMKRLASDEDILAKNRKTIARFDGYLLSLGLKVPRRVKYIYLLTRLSKNIRKPFEKVTKEDMLGIVAGVQSEKHLSEYSKVDRKVALKRFWKWLKGKDEFYPLEVRWIKTKLKNDRCKLPEELITEEEVKKMADAADNPRDKALIQCLYETGSRIGELMTVQIKNVVFDQYGALLRVTGKTGERRIRIVASSPALATWMDFHPDKENPEAFVWIRQFKTGRKSTGQLPFRYNNIAARIRKLAEKAGVKKRVNPHSFRHARATVLANKLTDAQMKEYFGWVQGSDMASVYVHLSGRDIDDAILKVYEVKNDAETKKEKFKPLECPRCELPNAPASKFCTKCGCVLNAETAMQLEDNGKKYGELMNTLMKDPEFRELMLKKMLENGSVKPA